MLSKYSNISTNYLRSLQKSLLGLPLCFLLFVSAVSIQPLQGQSSRTDSLKQVLRSAKDDKGKVLTYIQLSAALARQDTLSSFEYLDKAVDLANNLDFPLGLGQAESQRAAIYALYGKRSIANQYYREAVDAYKKADDNSRIMQIYQNMSANMKQIGHYTEALQYELDAYVYAKILGDKAKMRGIVMGLANLYGKLKDYPKALEAQKEAYNICIEICNDRQMATALNNLGSAYKDSKVFDKAVSFLHKSLLINDTLQAIGGLIYNYATLSEVHQLQGDIDSAYYYAEKSLELSIESKNQYDILYGYNDMGRVLIGQGKYQQAIQYLEKSYLPAVELAKQNDNYEEIVGLAIINLYRAHENLGNYKIAYQFLSKHNKRQETLYNDYIDKSTKIQQYYDAEQKQAQIDLLNKANALKEAQLETSKLVDSSLIAGAIIALIFVFIMYRNATKSKRANVLLNSKNKAIQKRNREIAEQKEQMEQAFQNVKLLSKVGQEVTSTLSVEKIIKTAYQNVNSLMKAEAFGIGIYDEKKERLEFPGFIEKGITYPVSYDPIADDNLLSIWSFKNQKDVIINDMQRDYINYIPDARAVSTPTSGEVPESILYVPVNTKDKNIGVVTVQSFEKNVYNEYHLDILRNLAIYVAIALENADNFLRIESASSELEDQKKLIEEKNITLAEQKEKIEQSYENIKLLGSIGQAVIAELSVDSIVATVYKNVNQLMDAAVFWIGVWDEQENVIVFDGGIEKGKVLEEFSMDVSDDNRLASWCLLNEEEIIIGDYLREYGKYVPMLKPAIAGEHAASIIYLPLMGKDGKMGVLTIQSFRKYAYTDYHVNILRNLATYITIALENALLYQNLETKVEERTAEIEAQKEEIEQSFKNIKLLSQIGQKITGMLSMDDIIQAIYAHVNDLMDASVFGVGIYEEKIDKIVFRGAMEEGNELPVFTHEMHKKRFFSAWSLTRKKEVFTNNAEEDYLDYVPEMEPPKEGRMPKSIIYLPLSVKDKSIGVITVQSFSRGAYTSYHVSILRNLAIYAAIALENAAAYRQIERQNQEINKATQKVRASINYAKRIQNAILPHRSTIENAFDDAFVLFKPRDIVSGDFFWFADKGNKKFLAAVDCTGHGVPGAFMSMIGNDLLDEIINVLEIEEVNVILAEMHKRVRKALKQEDTDNRDGMDMSLCMIDLERNVLEFAGAKNPLIYIQENEDGKSELKTIKGDKVPIGGVQREKERIFTKHTIKLHRNQSILANGEGVEEIQPTTKPINFYIFSDGYQDQFGGRNGRKFMIKNMRNLLLKIHDQPMASQRETLKEIIEMWMEDEQQTDDILVLGFRL